MGTILVCRDCGTDNIQSLAWVDANTNKYVCNAGLNDNDNDKWCNDCEDYVQFEVVDVENFILNQIADGK